MTKAFSKWYEKNKGALAEKRKKRYREDLEYRAKVLEAVRQRRAAKRGVTPPGMVSFSDAAEQLGVTPAQLRVWRSEDLYPEPQKMDGRVFFTVHQVQLMKKLVGAQGEDLALAVEYVLVNWS